MSKRPHLLISLSLLLIACERLPLRTETHPTAAFPETGQLSATTSAVGTAPEATNEPVPTSITTPEVGEEAPVGNAIPQDFQGLGKIASVGGATTAVEVAGDYILVGIGAQLVTAMALDGDPSAVSSLAMPGVVEDIQVAGRRAYVATGDKGICVVTMSLEGALTPESCLAMPGTAVALELQEPYLYVATKLGGLRVLDVSNPAALFQTGVYTDVVSVIDLAVTGTSIYLAVSGWDGSSLTDSSGILELDISQPQQPSQRSFFATGEVPVTEVVLQDERLYALTGWNEVPGIDNRVRVFQIADSGELSEIHSLYAGASVSALVALPSSNSERVVGVVKRCDYMTSGDCRSTLVTVEVPRGDSPSLAESMCEDCNWYGSAEDAALAGSRLYVAAGAAGLRVYDIHEYPDVSYLGSLSYPLQGDIVDVVITGERGVVAAKHEGLHILDLANPLLPLEIGVHKSPDTDIRSAVVREGLVYSAASSSFRVFDISGGADPELVSSLAISGLCWGVTVDGHYAYLSVVDSGYASVDDGTSAGLWVIDVHSPTSPTRVGIYPALAGLPADPSAIWNVLYTTDFAAVDITRPTTLRVLGTLPILGQGYQAVTVADGYAYVAAGSAGLLVIDIRDLTLPRKVARYEALLVATDVQVVDGYAYVAAGEAGLSVLNVANPNEPVEVARLDTPGYAYRVQVQQDNVYVADGFAGLTVLSR